MVVGKLAAVVVEAPVLQEPPRPRMVQPAVVQDDEPGKRREIRPDVVMTRRIAELIDHKIVGIAPMLPDEVVGAQLGNAVDDVAGAEQREQLGAVRGALLRRLAGSPALPS